MSSTRIKICGLTRGEDVRFAVACGADAIGFVFANSPRRVDTATAARLADQVPAGVMRVGLFLDQGEAEVDRVLASVALDVLQFHGRETERQCSRHGLPWLKAVGMANAGSLTRAEHDFPGAMGLLLDSHQAGERGGSGKIFDWSRVPKVTKPIWLAGGLNTANVAQAISVVGPWAVDVSSGVESAPGIKDADKVSAFIEAVRMTGETVAGKELND